MGRRLSSLSTSPAASRPLVLLSVLEWGWSALSFQGEEEELPGGGSNTTSSFRRIVGRAETTSGKSLRGLILIFHLIELNMTAPLRVAPGNSQILTMTVIMPSPR